MPKASPTIRKLGRFELDQFLGRGYQGSVYLARDPDLDRAVAIKVLNPRGARDGGESVSREGRMAAQLRHPNIVSIHEAGAFKGRAYLVFEYVRGDTLRKVLERDGPMPLAPACRVFRSILDGLVHAHAAGVLHLDLSPGNILIDEDGVPRVMDFGLARSAACSPDPGEAPIGTPRYMAPEYLSRHDLGAYTDVYALALIFYEMLSGEPARNGKSVARVLRQAAEGTVDLGGLDPASSHQGVQRFLGGALARDPSLRYRDAAAMHEALLALVPESDLAAGDENAGKGHSTVEFLLRRMEHKSDFPALSSSLTEINRLSSASSGASARQLTNVILRDYALTNKLLKLANSAFYRGGGNEVTSISHAVRMLGFEQIQLLANSLVFASHMRKGENQAELLNATVRSFTSGLIARHVARSRRFNGVEEAFICGMFKNLGENLVIYYFPEEQAAIRHLMEREGVDARTASSSVLGIGYEDVGVAVAKSWKFPDTITAVIGGLPDGPVARPTSSEESLRVYSSFANALCQLVGRTAVEMEVAAIEDLLQRFSAAVPISASKIPDLFESTLEKLRQFAPILSIKLDADPFAAGIEELLDYWRREAEEHEMRARPA